MVQIQQHWLARISVYIEKVDLRGRPPQTPLLCVELYPRFILIFYAISGLKKISSVFDSRFKQADFRGVSSTARSLCGQVLAWSLQDTQIMHSVHPNAGTRIQIWIRVLNLGLHSELGDTFWIGAHWFVSTILFVSPSRQKGSKLPNYYLRLTCSQNGNYH
jgi:hypothetical protein